MMYNNKFVVAVKHDGKILREVDGKVYLPFGSEYSVLLKNLNSVRALVTVEIDGQDVANGSQIIVNANDSIEIERFINRLDKGNRFKFIEKTSDVEQHRGSTIDDGLIRVSFQFEKPLPNLVPYEPCKKWTNPWDYPYNPYRPIIIYSDNTEYSNNSTSIQDLGLLKGTSSTYSADVNCNTTLNNCDGITVPGSISNQEFQQGEGVAVEDQTNVIVLHLVGQTSKTKVRKPVTTKTKVKCITCGKVNKPSFKFCSRCGTSLTIV